MEKILTLFLLSIINATAFASNFSTISIKDCSKEKVSKRHLRFTCSKLINTVIHLQVGNYEKENFWKQETLGNDIKKMEVLRKKVSSIIGHSDYKIIKYDFVPDDQVVKLMIAGSYRNFNDQLIQFSEINIYGNKKFIQLKLVGKNFLIAKKEIDELINEVLSFETDIDKWE